LVDQAILLNFLALLVEYEPLFVLNSIDWLSLILNLICRYGIRVSLNDLPKRVGIIGDLSWWELRLGSLEFDAKKINDFIEEIIIRPDLIIIDMQGK
jgi:hypothetical protein